MEFQKEYVKCVWSDDLRGVKCLCADTVTKLKEKVEHNSEELHYFVPSTEIVCEPGCTDFPFNIKDNAASFRYVYADLYYEFRLALIAGKTLQFSADGKNDWEDVKGDDARGKMGRWAACCFRIKVEEEKSRKPYTKQMFHEIFGFNAVWLCRDEDFFLVTNVTDKGIVAGALSLHFDWAELADEKDCYFAYNGNPYIPCYQIVQEEIKDE